MTQLGLMADALLALCAAYWSAYGLWRAAQRAGVRRRASALRRWHAALSPAERAAFRQWWRRSQGAQREAFRADFTPARAAALLRWLDCDCD